MLAAHPNLSRRQGKCRHRTPAPENVTRLIDRGDSANVYDLDVMIDPDERFLLLGSIRNDGFGTRPLSTADVPLPLIITS